METDPDKKGNRPEADRKKLVAFEVPTLALAKEHAKVNPLRETTIKTECGCIGAETEPGNDHLPKPNKKGKPASTDDRPLSNHQFKSHRETTRTKT